MLLCLNHLHYIASEKFKEEIFSVSLILYSYFSGRYVFSIDQFPYVRIPPPKATDLNSRPWRINTEFVGFIPLSLVLKS